MNWRMSKSTGLQSKTILFHIYEGPQELDYKVVPKLRYIYVVMDTTVFGSVLPIPKRQTSPECILWTSRILLSETNLFRIRQSRPPLAFFHGSAKASQA